VTPIIRTFRKYTKAPYVVVANKQDEPSTQAPEVIRKALSLPDNVLVLPCVALEKASVVKVLEQVRQLLR
jgi:signal recognition particle receptor subunit beta